MGRCRPGENVTETKTRYTLIQPAGLDIRALAKKQGMNINQFVRTALIDYVQRNELSA